jgi:hypothetical protein
MNRDLVSYPDWKAPTEDSAFLIWPEPAELLANLQANFDRLNQTSTPISGIPLSELRRRQRQWLNLPIDKPIIATGHQTELYHAGVWAKLALINAAAKKIGAEALHVAVDTDAAKHLHLRWPGGSEPLTDDPRLTTADWSGMLDGPTPGQLQQVMSALQAAEWHWPFKPMANEFLAEMRRLSLEQPKLSTAITRAMHRLDWSLGFRHQSIIVSPIWQSDPYLAIAHHLLSRPSEFARAYNGALADYRKSHRIRTAARPMPDLQTAPDVCEVAFWLDDLASESRQRAEVVRDGDGDRWKLMIAGDAFALDPNADGWESARSLQKFLRDHQCRLSPRALTLTLFFRLLVADQFVHGIGGGRYDQVTDQVIATFFQIDPPAFSVTTATLYFPTAVGRPRICLPCIAQEGHRLRHAVLGQEKMDLVHQIESLPRHSQQRHEIFTNIHRRLNELATTHPAVKSWQQRVEHANREAFEEIALFDRELFYAMQPRDRLMQLIEKYETAFE